MAIIDRTLVQRLIQTQLATLQGGGVVDVVMPGEEDPETSQRWVKLVAIDFAPVRGQKANVPATSDVPEHAAITVAMSVFCAPSLVALSSGALTMAISHVCAAMEQQTLRDAPTNHQVDLHSATVSNDAPADNEQPAILSAGITIDGQVCRTSGTSLIAVP